MALLDTEESGVRAHTAALNFSTLTRDHTEVIGAADFC